MSDGRVSFVRRTSVCCTTDECLLSDADACLVEALNAPTMKPRPPNYFGRRGTSWASDRPSNLGGGVRPWEQRYTLTLVRRATHTRPRAAHTRPSYSRHASVTQQTLYVVFPLQFCSLYVVRWLKKSGNVERCGNGVVYFGGNALVSSGNSDKLKKTYILYFSIFLYFADTKSALRSRSHYSFHEHFHGVSTVFPLCFHYDSAWKRDCNGV